MRTEILAIITQALDDYLKAETHLHGNFSEAESLEIIRIFTQSLRRVTIYGGANSGAISEEVQGNNGGNVPTDKQEKS
jgi:hypothetical protein